MSTPLTDSINALTAYANETTGASDATLSDAVGRLCEGYGGGICKTQEVKLEAYSTTLSIPVESKPWAFLLWRDSDSYEDGHTVVTRASGLWSYYGDGAYVGGRVCISRPNDTFDHYNYPDLLYDDEAKTFTFAGRHEFGIELPYTFIYLTEPDA